MGCFHVIVETKDGVYRGVFIENDFGDEALSQEELNRIAKERIAEIEEKSN